MTMPDFRDQDAEVAQQLALWERAHPWQVTDARVARIRAGVVAVREMFDTIQQVNPDQVSTGETI